jgi:phosphoribosylglycinamide formyltransferase-1
MTRTRVAVLISGRGSNLQSLLDAAADPDFPAEITLVISNRPDAAGLARAEKAGVASFVIDHRTHASREDFEGAVDRALREANIRLVCLAGFMRLLSPAFVKAWEGRLINIHPSLLPAFRGLDAHARMLDAGVKIAGCTVHFVSAETDAGPIIGQAAIAVRPDDTPVTLAARILEQEHRLYPACLRIVAEGKAIYRADNIVQLSAPPQDGALMNPGV